MTDDRSRRVLFVCMGNICRSPAGEGLFRAALAERGFDDEVEVDSAGTIAYHTGDPPDPRMQRAAAHRGYDLGGAARQVRDDDFERFDLIVAMDRENLSELRSRAESADDRDQALRRLALLSDFLPESAPKDVPDPYYGGAQGFETVLDMIEQACPAILDRILDVH